MVRVLYICGPMTGLPAKNYYAFRDAERELASRGVECLNPASLPEGLSYEQYMDIDMAMVRNSLGVVTLPGWTESKGARAEVAYATAIGKPVRDLAEVLAELDTSRIKISCPHCKESFKTDRSEGVCPSCNCVYRMEAIQ
jgi:nucleoside 2-deoxyribosyltransferase